MARNHDVQVGYFSLHSRWSIWNQESGFKTAQHFLFIYNLICFNVQKMTRFLFSTFKYSAPGQYILYGLKRTNYKTQLSLYLFIKEGDNK